MRTCCSRATMALVLTVAALLAAGAALWAAQDAQTLLARAQAEYDKHNYKQALVHLDALLKAHPTHRPAQRLKLLSMCKPIRPRMDGYAYGKKIMTEHKPFAKDPDLWRAMGDERMQRYDRRNAYDCFKAAADLYEGAKKPTQAADALFRLAECLASDHYILPQQRKVNDWQKRRRIGIDEALKTYERIVGLKVDVDRKGRALAAAGQVVSQLGDWASAERGLAYWRRCVKEFPKAKDAGHCQLYIGLALERFEKYVEAVKAYRKAIEEFSKQVGAQAKIGLDRVRDPRIIVSLDKPYLPGEKAGLFWLARNVKKLNLTAWQVDLTEALERLDKELVTLERVEQSDGKRKIIRERRYPSVQHFLKVLQAVRGEVAAEWTFATPDKGEHQYHQHRRLSGNQKQTTQPIALPFSKAGAYLVRADGVNPDNRKAESWCLVLFTGISAVAKADADQTLVLVDDALTGKPAAGAKVVVARQWGSRRVTVRQPDGSSKRFYVPYTKTATVEVNDAGLAEAKFPSQRSCTWLVAAKKGPHQALCSRAGYYWSWWGYHEPIKVYGFTERPVYRPKQTARFKQIIRQHTEGLYKNYAGKSVEVRIRDPRGKTVYSKKLITDEFGAVEGELPIGEKFPLGLYRIDVRVGGRHISSWYAKGNQFRVEEYKKPEFKVAVEPGQKDYRIGDRLRIKINARYYFGQPVSGAEVKYRIRKESYSHHYAWPREWQWYYDAVHYGGGYGRRPYYPWWRPRFREHVADGTVKTDANGDAFVEVKADPIKGHEKEKIDLKFVVEAEVTDASRRVIRGKGEVKVTHAPFFIYPKPSVALYGPGDSVEIQIRTEDPNGKPVAGKFTAEAWRIERIRKVVKTGGNERVEFEEKLAQKLASKDLAAGASGRALWRFVPDVTGRVKIVIRQKAAAVKKGFSPVEGSCYLWIASRTGVHEHYAYNDLQIVPAKDQYETGQKLRVLINTAKTGSHVLLTGEAEGILFHRMVHVAKNSTMVELPVVEKFCPNFTLTATLLRNNKLYQDSKQIVVPPTHKFLKVQVTTAKGSKGGGEEAKYQPREKTKVRLKVTDQRTGKPIVGQVTVMMVDSSVYYIQPEFRAAVEKAFYGYTRGVRVSSANSFAGLTSLNPRVQRPYRYGWGGYNRYGQGMEMQQAARQAPGGMPEPSAPAPAAADALRAPAKALAEREEAAPPLADAVMRKFFKDTVLWAGSVVTDADGTAEIDVELPDQLTTFALHAIAVDKDTRVGQAKTDVITTKRIIVRLEGGRFFTEGDHAYVTVIAHNYYKQPQDVFVDLDADDALKIRKVNVGGAWKPYEAGEAVKVRIPAGGEVRLDFLTTAQRPASVKITARARSTRESDAIQLVKPILPWGAEKLIASGGRLTGKAGTSQQAQWTLTVPEKIKSGSQSLVVTLNPSIAAVAMDALPYLARYPYGCTEQTMSRFLPTVVMRRTVQQAGVKLSDIRTMIEQRMADDPKLAARYKLIRQRMNRNPVYNDAEVDKMVAAGVKRLASFQRPQGGWGWWKHGSPDPYMTSYVLMGLCVARECDVKLPRGMIDRAAKWLAEQAGKPIDKDNHDWWYRHVNNTNTRAFMLYAVSRADAKRLTSDKKLAARVKELYDERDELSDYGRALLALVLHAAGRKKEATIVVENFDNTALVDKKIHTAHWGRTHGWWYWYHGATETTAWVLQAMLTVRPNDKYIPQAVEFLVRNRRRMYWYNTKSTAMVVYALARYAKAAGELDCDQTFEVTVGGVTRAVKVRRENLFTFDSRVEIPAEQLAPGKHEVRVVRRGKGTLYWGAYLRYFDMADRIKGGGNQIALKRTYYRLIPEKFQNTRSIWRDGKVVKETFPDFRYKEEKLAFGAEIASGEMIQVKVDIEAENNFEYLVFEDPKPAGCEPYRLVSGSTYGGGAFANMELRDTKIVFFANWLSRGKRSLSYRLVCEQPGTFRVLPTSGEAMYTPFIQAISDSGKLVVTTKPEAKGQ